DARDASDGSRYEPAGYDPAYDPYAVPAGASAEAAGYTYRDPAYATGTGAPGEAGWDGGSYPADPGAYAQQQTPGYGDGYGYVPPQPDYDPYAAGGHGAPSYGDDQTYSDAPYGGGPAYGDGADAAQQTYDEQGRPVDGERGAYADPAAYFPEGDQRRDGSDYR
ncbi:MAG TPA: hypothetical protein VIW71_01210, partial [Streptomyces sp.]